MDFIYVFIETDNPDGNEYHDVVHYSKAGWHIPNDDHVTHWQPLSPPKSV